MSKKDYFTTGPHLYEDFGCCRYAEHPGQIDLWVLGGEGGQLTPEQARALAAELVRLAEEIEK